MMRLTKQLLLLALLLLCSCLTTEKVQDYLAEKKQQPAAEAIVADWLEQHREWYAAKAANDFPAKDSVRVERDTVLVPSPVACDTVPCPAVAPAEKVVYRYVQRAQVRPDTSFFEKTIKEQELVLQQSRQKLEAARAALRRERATHAGTQRQLKKTEAARDYYRELNRKKFWALIAMGIFALLYILFKVLAARVRET